MRNFKLLVAAAMLAVSTSSFAQTANESNGVLVMDAKSYTRVSAGYLMGRERWKYSGFEGADGYTTAANKDIKNLNGFRISAIEGIHLTKNLPLFLETGLNFDFGTRKYSDSKSKSDRDYSYKYTKDKTDTYFAMAIPVNLTYKFIFKPGFYIAPYAGFNLKFNLVGKSKTEEKTVYTIYGETESESETNDVNWFKSDDKNMGKDGAYNRFQFGGQVGVNFGYKMINLGLGYQWDTPLHSYSKDGMKEKLNTGSFNLLVGVNF